MKKLFKSGLKDMREVFKKFRKLNAKEKSELVSEHARALKEYVVELRKFVQALPPNRLDDYKALKVANNAKLKSVEDAGPSNKKLKLNWASLSIYWDKLRFSYNKRQIFF